ncbi:MAG: thioredoxin family protein [Aliifodinibius sp.]|nr:thioredoxin family protein [Fodinibius sp.]NIW96777.1 thioredoxin family protein [Phycisphaerae bacterium]NIY25245.1 thioredoxin family protein [Fodinibius sp.]
MKSIQVYGPGCANCQKLYNLATEVINELDSNINLEKVEDINDMMAVGVMRTPALGFDGKVVLQGKIPTAATLKNWIYERQEQE